MSIEIVENPAQDVSVQLQETFEKWSSEVSKASKRPLRYGDGSLIKLNGDIRYVVTKNVPEVIMDKDEENG